MTQLPHGAAKFEWIDCIKGSGILLVAAAHIVLYGTPARDVIHVFHMPLFFFLSGYLFKPDPDGVGYAVKKARHLLVPYFAFLFLLSVPIMVKMSMAGKGSTQLLIQLAGGQRIGGTMAVLWFVTCLYFTQQVMNFLLARWSTRVVALVVLAGLAASYANLWHPEFWLPFNLHVVSAAMPYFFLGYLCKDRAPATTVAALAWIGSAIAIAMSLSGYAVAQDMKYTIYGIPVLSLALAICMSVAFMHLNLYLARAKPIATLLAGLGRHSMGVMFLHMPIAVAMRTVSPGGSETLRFVVAVVASYAVSLAFDRFTLTRSIFLGAAHRTTPASEMRPARPARPAAPTGPA
jgi:fucose 4-O-acetylase-like acetyltransferase